MSCHVMLCHVVSWHLCSCHAWFVFWHHFTSSHLVSCYMASHKQARFVDVSNRKLSSGLVLCIYFICSATGEGGTRRGGFKYYYCTWNLKRADISVRSAKRGATPQTRRNLTNEADYTKRGRIYNIISYHIIYKPFWLLPPRPQHPGPLRVPHCLGLGSALAQVLGGSWMVLTTFLQAGLSKT